MTATMKLVVVVMTEEEGFGGELAGVENNVDNQIPEIIVAVVLFLYNITFRCVVLHTSR